MLNSVSERNQGAREDAAQVLTRAARPSFERRAEKEGGRERGTIRPPGKRLMNDFRRATTTQRRRRKGRRQPSRKCRADLVTRRGHRDSGTNGTETRLFFRAPFTSTPRNDATRAGGSTAPRTALLRGDPVRGSHRDIKFTRSRARADAARSDDDALSSPLARDPRVRCRTTYVGLVLVQRVCPLCSALGGDLALPFLSTGSSGQLRQALPVAEDLRYRSRMVDLRCGRTECRHRSLLFCIFPIETRNWVIKRRL